MIGGIAGYGNCDNADATLNESYVPIVFFIKSLITLYNSRHDPHLTSLSKFHGFFQWSISRTTGDISLALGRTLKSILRRLSTNIWKNAIFRYAPKAPSYFPS